MNTMNTDSEKATRLIAIANQIKTIGGSDKHTHTNAIFAYLLWYALQGEMGLTLEIETNDRTGHDWMDGYFDLLVIRQGEVSVCIPMPLLTKYAIIATMKKARFVDRGDHERKCLEAPGEYAQLVREWSQMAYPGVLATAENDFIEEVKNEDE